MPENFDLTGSRGTILVRNYSVQYTRDGVRFSAADQGHPPSPRPRPRPVFVRPDQPPELLDRGEETRASVEALRVGSALTIHGARGIGKTALLSSLAYDPVTHGFPDGVVWLPAPSDAPDLLRNLYDAFYEHDGSYQPTDEELRRALRETHALIMLDDAELTPEDGEEVANAAPSSAFVMASAAPHPREGERVVSLRGLPADDALALVEWELRRPQGADERSAAETLYRAVEGNPALLVQAAAKAREDGEPLSRLAYLAGSAAGTRVLLGYLYSSLPEQERELLKLLAGLDGADIGATHLASLSSGDQPERALDALHRRGLVQTAGGRYRLAGSIEGEIGRLTDLSPQRTRLLAYLSSWAERSAGEPSYERATIEAALHVLRWAVHTRRWTEALRLACAIEPALFGGGRWGAWGQVLVWQLAAAQALGEGDREAWALHQLGSRAIWLGDDHTPLARSQLERALQVREALGDHAGADATRQNLRVVATLGGIPSTPVATARPPERARAARAVLLTAVVGAVGLLAALAALVQRQAPDAASGVPLGSVAPIGGDTVSPKIELVTPKNHSKDVPTTTEISAVFSEAMNPATLTADVFALERVTRHGSAVSVEAAVTYDPSRRSAILRPAAELEPSKRYRATVEGGLDGPADLAGNRVTRDRIWTFTTERRAAAAPATFTPAVRLRATPSTTPP